MEVPKEIRRHVREYHDTYRNPALSAPEVSDIYALFPKDEHGVDAPYGWPTPWPNAGRSGVYFILGADLNILYIGKAAGLGARLASYFRYGPNRECQIKSDDWTARPAFVITIAIGEWFEASSMEEYLIRQFNPPGNKLWVENERTAT